jgi:hypothetical protein
MPTSAPPGSGFARRPAETRGALVHAARQILAEAVAAVMDTLEEFGQTFDARLRKTG